MSPTICTLAAVPVFALAAAGADGSNYQLQADKTGWGDAGHADVVKVLRSACDSIYAHFPDGSLREPIRVRRGDGGPITLFRRNLRGEVVVLLDTGDRFWCQYAYQMAHEFCHILCGFRKGGRRNLWFEESLCEMASLFAMRSMAESWKTAPPYPNWKGYSKSIRDYVSEVEGRYHLPADTTLAAYYAEHARALAANPTDRDRNGRVALALLPLFEKEPHHWPAVAYLNRGRGKDDLPFPEHLENWHGQAPAEHRPFIKKVAARLGVAF